MSLVPVHGRLHCVIMPSEEFPYSGETSVVNGYTPLPLHATNQDY